MNPSASATSPASFHLEPPPPPTAGVPFWPRAGARLLDWLPGMLVGSISGAVGAIASLVLGIKLLPTTEAVASMFVTMPFALVSGVVVSSICETYAGGTLGKLLLGLRVTRLDGGPIQFTQALKRNIAYIWDVFFFGLVAHGAMAQSPLNQRVGDRWAQTLVVRAGEANLHVRRTVLGSAAGIVAAYGVSSLMQAVGFVLAQVAFG